MLINKDIVDKFVELCSKAKRGGYQCVVDGVKNIYEVYWYPYLKDTTICNDDQGEYKENAYTNNEFTV